MDPKLDPWAMAPGPGPGPKPASDKNPEKAVVSLLLL